VSSHIGNRHPTSLQSTTSPRHRPPTERVSDRDVDAFPGESVGIKALDYSLNVLAPRCREMKPRGRGLVLWGIVIVILGVILLVMSGIAPTFYPEERGDCMLLYEPEPHTCALLSLRWPGWILVFMGIAIAVVGKVLSSLPLSSDQHSEYDFPPPPNGKG
jgi:hypothetical protein